MYTYAGVYALAISILFSNPGWGGGAKNIRALFTPSLRSCAYRIAEVKRRLKPIRNSQNVYSCVSRYCSF